MARRISRSRRFFSPIGRVRTGKPVFGAFPVGPQTHDGIADSRRAQGLGAQADVTADLGQQRQRPRAPRFAERPRTLVQQTMDTLALGGIQHGLDRTGDAGLRSEARQPRCAKACRALRTVWTLQPTWVAIWAGVWCCVLASKIWHRRKVNACLERKPPSRWRRSSSVNGRTKIGGFIDLSMTQEHPFAQDLC